MDAGHDDDVLELGNSGLDGRRARLPGGWRPSRGAVVLAAATLAVGLAAGYAAHGSQATAPAPRATVTVTATPLPAKSDSGIATPATSFPYADSSALIQDVASCSIQTGHQLQLGVQVSNESSDAITLRSMRAVLPLGGLKPLALLWGPCGSLQAGTLSSGTGIQLEPGETAWLTVTVRVQVPCPAPLPVQFSVGYLAGAKSFTASLPGFPDLASVPYSGCKSGTQATIVVINPATGVVAH